MTDPMVALLLNIQFRLDRLESHVRRYEKVAMELSKHSSVLNRKVELILDQQETDEFLEEENSRKKGLEEPPRAVAGMSQADAQATALVQEAHAGDI